MAELNNTGNARPNKKGRTRKIAPKVDLTAMVDLAFLLITFFMLTTSLNKPNSLDVAVPDKNIDSTVDMDEERIVNIVIHENMFSIFYGDIMNPIQIINNIDLKKYELKDHLSELKETVDANTGGKSAIVLIKPTNHATTKNIIQSFDEIKSANIKHYMLSKLGNEEQIILN